LMGLEPFILVAILIAFVVLIVRRKWAAATVFRGLFIFGIGFAIAIAPWVIHNNLQSGQFGLLESAPDTISPVFDYLGSTPADATGNIRRLPPDLAIDPKSPACHATGSTEELDRYWGFDTGWGHFLTLPLRTVMNLDSAGYYVTTMPALLLLPLVLLLPLFWMKKGRALRWLFLGSIAILVQWIFLANGVPWYGMGMLLGLVVILEGLVVFAPDALNRVLIVVLIAFSLMGNFANRFWQFEQQRNLLEYPLGKISAEALQTRTIPYYDGIRAVVTQRHETLPDRPYLYRVGTFIPYFIPKNLEIIGITDHQLDAFNCLYQEKNPELTLKRLEALGMNSIIFDTNTATIERDPEGSLHKKAEAFAEFLNTPSLHLQVLVNDNNAGVVFVLLP
jgi:hypothetical protein